ncbi:hypothetical protein LTR36_003668 [Oleoguttula mirabilis]|uniref:Uncharacterized protein n=1 Tax=Oleoguttula mirabilis TaxID=1507867 RepID=A0AAV9JIL0_9PEZI|nr:hypothetical protein LTR36_003668 [Oleoguttula mirabilis]
MFAKSLEVGEAPDEIDESVLGPRDDEDGEDMDEDEEMLEDPEALREVERELYGPEEGRMTATQERQQYERSRRAGAGTSVHWSAPEEVKAECFESPKNPASEAEDARMVQDGHGGRVTAEREVPQECGYGHVMYDDQVEQEQQGFSVVRTDRGWLNQTQWQYLRSKPQFSR